MPFSVYFGRAVMPDMLMLLAAILAIWMFRRWLERPTAGRFGAALLCGALAPLAKTPNLLIVAVPLAYLVIADWACGRNIFQIHALGRTTKDKISRTKGVNSTFVLRRSSLAVYGVCFVLPSLLWMRHASALPLDSHLSFGIDEK